MKKTDRKIRRRLLYAVLAFAGFGLLCGCGGSDKGSHTTLTADDAGSITQKIVEPRDDTEFSQEELEAYVTAQTGAYQNGSVEMESCKADAQQVEIVLKYASWKDYADFNQVVCFQGTIAEAADAGYDMKQIWVDGSGKPADAETIRERENEWKVFILEEPVRVKMPDKILYTTDNVTVTGRLTARVDTVMQDDGTTEQTDAQPAAAASSSAGAEEEPVQAVDGPAVINRYATVADRYAYIIYK